MSINNLSKEIAKYLSQFSKEVEEELEKAKDDITKDAVKQLKVSSPKKTGSYRKGWTRKKVGKSYVIYNKTDYRLTHLLENGHAKSTGGRVAAQVHITPVEENSIKEFVERVERVIKG